MIRMAILVLVLAISGSSVSSTAAMGPRAVQTVIASGRWSWPVQEPRPILRPFIAPATPYSSGHRGIDIGANVLLVLAPDDGIVRFAGFVVDRPVLSIVHAGGVISSYEPVESTLAAGEAVRRGEVIGTILDGHCSTKCLHFGARVDGAYVSPLNYLATVESAVLMPTRR